MIFTAIAIACPITQCVLDADQGCAAATIDDAETPTVSAPGNIIDRVVHGGLLRFWARYYAANGMAKRLSGLRQRLATSVPLATPPDRQDRCARRAGMARSGEGTARRARGAAVHSWQTASPRRHAARRLSRDRPARLRRSPPKLLTESRGLGKRARRDDRIATVHPVGLRLRGREELTRRPVAVVRVGGQGHCGLSWRLSSSKEQRVLRERAIGGRGDG